VDRPEVDRPAVGRQVAGRLPEHPPKGERAGPEAERPAGSHPRSDRRLCQRSSPLHRAPTHREAVLLRSLRRRWFVPVRWKAMQPDSAVEAPTRKHPRKGAAEHRQAPGPVRSTPVGIGWTALDLVMPCRSHRDQHLLLRGGTPRHRTRSPERSVATASSPGPCRPTTGSTSPFPLPPCESLTLHRRPTPRKAHRVPTQESRRRTSLLAAPWRQKGLFRQTTMPRMHRPPTSRLPRRASPRIGQDRHRRLAAPSRPTLQVRA
jgi:hypothetical protein